MKTLFFILSAIFFGCSVSTLKLPDGTRPATRKPIRGDEVGNGGDFIRILMEEGRFYAAGVLHRLRADAYPNNIDDYLERGEHKWLVDNQTAFEKDLKRSKFVWVKELPEDCPKEECGCALKDEKEIYFSSVQCEAKLNKRQDAAKLILHEVMHHFVGDNEAKAKRLGVALYSAWYNMGHPDSPHWKMFTIRRSLLSWTPYVLDKNGLTIWGDKRSGKDFEMATFHPDTETWVYEDTANSPAVFANDSPTTVPLFGPLSTPVGIYLFTDLRLHGGLFNTATKRWNVIAPPGFSQNDSVRFLGKNLVATQHGDLIAWDSTDYEFTGLPANTVGAMLDAKTKRWQPISRKGSPASKIDSSSLWIGDRLFVWEGNQKENSELGATYNPANDTWTNLPKENAPTRRENPSLVWTGHEVILFGGTEGHTRKPRDFTSTGAIYNPKTNQWRPMKNGPDRKGLLGGSPCSVWTGTAMIYLRDGRIDSYDPFHDSWWTSGDVISYPDTKTCPVWTGMELISWDGLNMGYLYYP